MHAKALVDTFIIPMTEQSTDAPILPELKLCVDDSAKAKHLKRNINNNKLYCYGPSPYLLLDNFVDNKLANRKGLNGSVRSWKLDSDVITYFMKDNRWCENINRSHKSNNIMWNVSLNDCTYWQSCLDPECKFRGIAKELPQNVKESVNTYRLQKAAEVDEVFERALMQINLDFECTNITINSNNSNHSKYDVDDDFSAALMKLNSACKPRQNDEFLYKTSKEMQTSSVTNVLTNKNLNFEGTDAKSNSEIAANKYDVDQDFISALMNLNVSACKQIRRCHDDESNTRSPEVGINTFKQSKENAFLDKGDKENIAISPHSEEGNSHKNLVKRCLENTLASHTESPSN